MLLNFPLRISASRWRTGFHSWWQLINPWRCLESTSETWQMVPGDSGSSQLAWFWLQVQNCKTAAFCTDSFWSWWQWRSVGYITAPAVNTSSCVHHLQVSCVFNICDSIECQVAENTFICLCVIFFNYHSHEVWSSFMHKSCTPWDTKSTDLKMW